MRQWLLSSPQIKRWCCVHLLTHGWGCALSFWSKTHFHPAGKGFAKRKQNPAQRCEEQTEVFWGVCYAQEWEACLQWEAELTGLPTLTIEHCSEQTYMLYVDVKLNLWFLHPPHFLELTISRTLGLFISRLLFSSGVFSSFYRKLAAHLFS